MRGGEELADRVTLEVAGDGFLYNMVRTIVGTLVEVGVGTRDVDWPAEVLAARDRRTAGQTAPPHGLFLVSVVLRVTQIHSRAILARPHCARPKWSGFARRAR